MSYYPSSTSSSSTQSHYMYPDPSAAISSQRCAVIHCTRLSPSTTATPSALTKPHPLNSTQVQMAALCFPPLASQKHISKGDVLCDMHFSMLQHYANDVATHLRWNEFQQSWNGHEGHGAEYTPSSSMRSESSHLYSGGVSPAASEGSNRQSLTYHSYQMADTSSDGFPAAEILKPNNQRQTSSNTNNATSTHQRVSSSDEAFKRLLRRRQTMRSTTDISLTAGGWIMAIVFLVIIALYVMVGIQQGTLFG